MPPTPPAERSVAAAVRVVQDYYAALGRRDYRTAYAIWHGARSYVAFRRGYAHTAWTKVTPLPPYRAEGAAGSSYAEINVRVEARLIDGTRQKFVGSYTLRRVNDVDGSTAPERRWRIVQAHLTEAPADR